MSHPGRSLSCPIPDVRFDERRLPLLIARATLRKLLAGLQANGVAEHFNDRISDVLKANHFNIALDQEQTLTRHVHLYNTPLPQSALGSLTPMQAMKDWQTSHPYDFAKSPRKFRKVTQRIDTQPRIGADQPAATA